MSRLTFNRHKNLLTLNSEQGQILGSWEAYNNVTASSNGVWPNGGYDYSHYNLHAGLDANSAYGTKGIYVFKVPGRTGMGVHAGRKDKVDGKGRKGPAYNTLGCIRTTEEAMTKIKSTHEGGDPLTEILVTSGVLGDFPKTTAAYA
ncbi:MAG: hypothetical protein IT424_03815 [Pirellulales bacterium]|nr:hypothetical protein [Pirellulales bacterium]